MWSGSDWLTIGAGGGDVPAGSGATELGVDRLSTTFLLDISVLYCLRRNMLEIVMTV
jgi:hypothetical protein